MIKAVLFDLDGVIADTAILHFKAWKKVAQELKKDISIEFNEQLKGVDREESLRRLLAHIEIKVDKKRFDEIASKKNDYYVESLSTMSEIDLLPGIKKLFEELKQRKIKIVIASASRNAPYILEKLNAMSYITAIADPALVEKGKPDPGIFLLAAKLSEEKLENIVGIEDSQAGIEALNAANIYSIAIGKGLENSNMKLNSTDELTIDVLSEI